MQYVTKRRVLATAASATLAGLAAPIGAGAQDMPAHERELYDAAKREGEITWYSGQYSAEVSAQPGARTDWPCRVVRMA